MADHHPVITKTVERVKNDAIGGAADTAREVVAALATLVKDSRSADVPALADEVERAVIEILRVMPSMAPPINGLHRIMAELDEGRARGATLPELRNSICRAGEEFDKWAEQAIQLVGEYGAEKIRHGDVVFMYSMSSSVWRILRKAKQQGKQFHVIVTEARPANEGLWTVAEMGKAGIPVSVSIDACIGELVPKCDLVFVGADSISSVGAALNKVGTYPTALVAMAHGVPFYVAADTLKFDTSTLIGLPFRIDPIQRHEVLGTDSNGAVDVVGRIFDVTPPELITAIVTEKGFVSPAAAATLMWQMRLSEKLTAMLPAWVRGEL